MAQPEIWTVLSTNYNAAICRNISNIRQNEGQILYIDRQEANCEGIEKHPYLYNYNYLYIRLLNTFANNLSSLQLKCQQFVNFNFMYKWAE